jgi:hypothetical protein
LDDEGPRSAGEGKTDAEEAKVEIPMPSQEKSDIGALDGCDRTNRISLIAAL